MQNTHTKKQKWQPVPHTVLKDEQLRQTLHTEGYAVVPFLNSNQITQLWNLYEQTHNFKGNAGGMFYSVYSQDLDYRKKVHQTIGQILQPVLDTFLQNYRIALNSFIIKASGPASEFYVHQDSTGTDEFKYSPISIWIPLHDIDANNGAMCIIPRSHKLFSPYRGISFKSPYENALEAVRPFLQPIYLKAGEALFFDNRLVHHSMPNLSGSPRVVVMSASYPAEAPLITCYKDLEKPDADIELIAHTDDFLFTNTNFLQNCHLRPTQGTHLGWVKDEYPMLTETELLQLFEQEGIVPCNQISTFSTENCNMIAEPDIDTDTIALITDMPAVEPQRQQVATENLLWSSLKKVFNYISK